MSSPEIKPFYEHRDASSVFVMFTKTADLIWSYSGNELRRIYLADPGAYLSGPLELPIPTDLDERLTAMLDDF